MKKSKKPSKNKAIKTSLRAPGWLIGVGLLLCCAGFFFLLAMLPVAAQSEVLRLVRSALNGVAGGTWFFLFPVLLVLLGSRIIVSLFHDVSFRAILLLTAVYVLALGLMTINTTIIGSTGNLMDFFAGQVSGGVTPTFRYFLRCAYQYGAEDLQGQGALGMLLAYPVWRFLGAFGGTALLIVLLLLCLIALFRLHPREWVNRLSNWSADHRLGYDPETPEMEEPVPENRAPVYAGGGYQVPQVQERPVWQDQMPPQVATQPAVQTAQSDDDGYFPVSSDQYYVENFQTEKPVQPVTQAKAGVQKNAFVPAQTAPLPWENAPAGQAASAGDAEGDTDAPAKDEPVFREALPVSREIAKAAAEQRKADEAKNTETPKRGFLSFGESRKPKADAKDAETKPEKPKEGTGDQHGVPSWLEQVKARKREASMAPADSQMTAAVENGARPVFTGNAVDVPIERVPIQPTGSESTRRDGRLDGTAKEEKPSIRVVSDVEYQYPPIELLNQGIDFNTQDHTQEDQQRAQKIEETLGSFNIESKVMQIMHGPAITRFAIQIAPGIRVQRVTGMADNLALSLATKHVRVEAPIQGTNFIGIEVPNKLISTVSLREVLDSREMRASKSPLAVSLGKDIAGTPVICDLSKMPHLLIAGATGSGKSVCIHSIVCSLLYRSSPKEVRLIMVDPKQVELSVYNGVPHLLIPVVTDVRKASGALGWVVQEMQDRYAKFKDRGVRNLEGYNRLNDIEEKLPNIVVIIDEMADLMDVCRKDVEESIRRLAALARAAGIYMVLATQRPSVDVITGVIKNNIPSRIAFAVSSGIDSRTILDTFGAEKLMGKGDMLYKPSGASASRVQGSFVSDDEVAAFTDYIRARHTAEYDQSILEHVDKEASRQKDTADMITGGEDEDGDNVEGRLDGLLQEAIQMAIEDGQTSTSMLQRRLRIGYARAGRLVDEMEKRGVVSAQDGSKPRKTIMTREQYYEMVADSEDS